MPMNPKERRQLMACANRLPVVATIAAADVSDAAIQHVRDYLGQHELAKVRINTPDRDDFRQAAETLAARIPCELVGRIGRVVVLHIPPERYSDSPVPRQ